MKYLAIVVLFVLSFSCSDSNSSKEEKIVKKESKTVKEVPLPSSPKKVATEFLNAYKIKDLATVKSLSGRIISMNFSGESFRSKIIKVLEKWNGTISDIKYMYGMAGTLNGIIPFGELDKDTVWALSLIYTGEKWVYSIDGFKKIKKEAFKDYPEQVFKSEMVLNSIVGSWKCAKKMSDGKSESQEMLDQLGYVFNNDKTVEIKKVGITAKGNYEVKNNIIRITSIKKTGPKTRKFIGKSATLMFKNSSAILLANDYTFAIFKK